MGEKKFFNFFIFTATTISDNYHRKICLEMEGAFSKN